MKTLETVENRVLAVLREHPEALGFQSFSGFSFKPPKIEKGAEFLSPAPAEVLTFSFCYGFAKR